MKIAVSGTHSSELLNKVAGHFSVECVNAVGNIYESAKVTYNYDNVENVVFNGCVLDYASNDMHLLDEQIVLCALDNLDVIYVYTPYMTAEEISKYHQFDEFYKGKIVDVANIDAFAIG